MDVGKGLMPARIEAGPWQPHNGCVAVQHAVCHRLMVFEMDPSATSDDRQAIIDQLKEWMKAEDDPMRIMAVVCDTGTSLVDIVHEGTPDLVHKADQIEAEFGSVMTRIMADIEEEEEP